MRVQTHGRLCTSDLCARARKRQKPCVLPPRSYPRVLKTWSQVPWSCWKGFLQEPSRTPDRTPNRTSARGRIRHSSRNQPDILVPLIQIALVVLRFCAEPSGAAKGFLISSRFKSCANQRSSPGMLRGSVDQVLSLCVAPKCRLAECGHGQQSRRVSKPSSRERCPSHRSSLASFGGPKRLHRYRTDDPSACTRSKPQRSDQDRECSTDNVHPPSTS